MTRRERLERKLEKREEWAAKARVRSAAAFARVQRIADGIPFGQPILVGHHSERHARRDQERIHSGMRKGCDEQALAAHHVSKAGGIEHALERSVFSDDADAIAQLEARIAELEAKRERKKRVNALFRKGDAAGLAALGLDLEKLRTALADAYSWCKVPHPAYELSNLGGRITADRKRIVAIRAQQARAAAAEAAGGVVIEGAGDYVRVTFAEKPSRDVLEALRAAAFTWGAGSWCGRRDALPESLRAEVADHARS